METKDRGLEKIQKMCIKKSISGFIAVPQPEVAQTREVFSRECLSAGTEGHHASHVLTFLSYMAYNAAKGKDVKQHLLKRAIHHLTALQEFIERPELNELVKSVLDSVNMQYGKFHEDAEQSAKGITVWLVRNQKNILRLAEFYGKQSVFDKLLPVKGPIGLIGVEGTAIRERLECHSVMGEQHLSMLFHGYFNNKMTLLVFLIQIKRHRLNEKSAQLACGFLDDMYRHMLPERLQKKYRLVFLWLKKFFLRLPDVTAEQRSKASRFIRSLYDVFGVNLNTRGQI